MSTELMPVCTIAMDNAELSEYDCYSDMPIETAVSRLIGADCWGVTTILDDVITAKKNTYALYERIGRCFNQTHPDFIPDPQYLHEEEWRSTIVDNPFLLLSELVNEGDQIDIYMFGSHSWKMRITKTEVGHTYDLFKSEEGLYI